MTSRTDKETASRAVSLAADMYERVLATGAAILLAAVLLAITRGYGTWAQVPLSIWLHLSTVLLALALTPVMLLRRRGDAAHRLLGWCWAIAMFATACLSFAVRVIRPGHFSAIHILSVVTVIGVPVLVLNARRHRVAAHRRSVRGLVTGALLIAGFFTFPFHRLLGQWLFG